MLIRCDKCNTVYELEDSLVPPQGAPVQCSKCQYVFKAYPPAPEPTQAGTEPARAVGVAAEPATRAPPPEPVAAPEAAASAEARQEPPVPLAASDHEAAPVSPGPQGGGAGVPQFTPDGRPIRKVPFPTEEQIASATRVPIAKAPVRAPPAVDLRRRPWVMPVAVAAALVVALLVWRLFVR